MTIGALLASTLVSAITDYEFADLSNLLPWISTIDGVPPHVRYVTDFVTAQYGVYNYEYNSSRISGYTAPVEIVAKMLLEVQSLYHKNRFADAIAMASSPSMTEAVTALHNAEQEQWAITVLEALMGVCHIALGQHDRARESLSTARQPVRWPILPSSSSCSIATACHSYRSHNNSTRPRRWDG